MASPFFHFGQSDDGKTDCFVYCGITTKTVLSQTQALPSGWAAATPDGDTRWLAFDSRGNWTSVISVRGGEKIGWNGGQTDNEADLTQFLTNAKDGRGKPRVIYGPKNRYFAWSLEQPVDVLGGSRTLARWNSSSMEKSMKPLLSSSFGAASTIPVQFIALGAGDSYYFKYQDTAKDPVFDLAGNYAALKEYLASKPKVNFLALHPYNPNQYFLVLSNGDIRARVSPSIKDILQPILLADAKVAKTKVDIDTV